MKSEINLQSFNKDLIKQKISLQNEISEDIKMSDLLPEYNSVQKLETLSSLLENLYGVKFRDLEKWMEKPVYKFLEHLNFMIKENDFIENGQFDEKELMFYYGEYYLTNFSHVDLSGTTEGFINATYENGLLIDKFPLSETLATVFNDYYLSVSSDELDLLDTFKKMSEVYSFLNQKLKQRRKNDYKVAYNSAWSSKLRNMTRERLSENTFFNLALSMKNQGGQYGIMTQMKPNEYYEIQDRETEELFEYSSVYEVIDAGWAVD